MHALIAIVIVMGLFTAVYQWVKPVRRKCKLSRKYRMIPIDFDAEIQNEINHFDYELTCYIKQDAEQQEEQNKLWNTQK